MNLSKLADVCSYVCGVLLFGNLPEVNSNNYVFFMTLPITSRKILMHLASYICQSHFQAKYPILAHFMEHGASETVKTMLLSEFKMNLLGLKKCKGFLSYTEANSVV